MRTFAAQTDRTQPAGRDERGPPVTMTAVRPGCQARFESDALPYMRQMFPAAVRLTGDRRDAEDLIQETFARAYAKFYQFTPGSSLQAWLYTIMTRTFYSTCRAHSRRPAEVPSADLLAAADGQREVSSSRTAEAEALDRLGDSPVMRALASLPEQLKTAIYLADVEGYRCDEIARLTGAPAGTIKSRVHRARKVLRTRLGPLRMAGLAGEDAAAA
jgi:RNA polymerase sigma-70 factor, ECF subfamily